MKSGRSAYGFEISRDFYRQAQEKMLAVGHAQASMFMEMKG